MDMEAFRTDLSDCLKQMPSDLMKLWIQIGRNHMQEMTTLLPVLAEKMKPHLYAGMVEAGMGALDKESLEKVCAEVFAEIAD